MTPRAFRSCSRGQTQVDFIFAVALFLIVVPTVFFTMQTFIFADTDTTGYTQQQIADSSTEYLTEIMLHSTATQHRPDSNIVVNKACTAAFYSQSTALDTGCVFNATTNLHDSLGVTGEYGIRTTITDTRSNTTATTVTVDGTKHTLSRQTAAVGNSPARTKTTPVYLDGEVHYVTVTIFDRTR